MRCSIAIVSLVLVQTFSVALVGCGQSSALTDGGPSDEDVIEQARGELGKEYFKGAPILQVQVLNKEIKGNESVVRFDVTYEAQDLFGNPLGPKTRAMVSRFVKSDGRWVLRDMHLG